MAEKKFEKLLKTMLDSSPPGFEFKSKLVPIDQNDQPAEASGANSGGARS